VPGWLIWLLFGLGAWAVLSISVTPFLGRLFRLSGAPHGSPRDEAPAPAEGLSRVGVPRARSLARRRILVVDDDAGLRMLLRATLIADEFEVAEAEDAQRASDLARFWRPTLVVLDVAMPGMDGLAFCSELKRKPAYGAAAVVLLTGTELAEAEAAGAGADALLRSRSARSSSSGSSTA
jgi:CheY-like chemotaxis protein